MLARLAISTVALALLVAVGSGSFAPLSSHPAAPLETSYFFDSFEEAGALDEDVWGIVQGVEVVPTSCGLVNDDDSGRTVLQMNGGGGDRSFATPALNLEQGAFIQFSTYVGAGTDCDAAGIGNRLVLEVVDETETVLEVLTLNPDDYNARWGQTYVAELAPNMLSSSTRVRVRQEGSPSAGASTAQVDDFMVGCPALIESEGQTSVAEAPFGGGRYFQYSPTTDGPTTLACTTDVERQYLMMTGNTPRSVSKSVNTIPRFAGGGTVEFDVALDCSSSENTLQAAGAGSNQASFGWLDENDNFVPIITPPGLVHDNRLTRVEVPLSTQFLDALGSQEVLRLAFYQSAAGGIDADEMMYDNWDLVDRNGSPGPAGLAFRFGYGVNATVPDFNVKYTEGVTVMAWLQVSSAAASVPEVIDLVGVPGQWMLQMQKRPDTAVWSAQVSFETKEGSQVVEVQGEAVPVDTWVHVAFAWDNTGSTAWFNGVEVAEGQFEIADKGNGPLADPGSTGLVMGNVPCMVDEVRVYNVALSSTRVAWGWNGLVSDVANDPGLVGYWRLDSTCPTFEDRSGNDNTGIAPLGVRRVVSSAGVASTLDLNLIEGGGLITLTGLDTDSRELEININALPEHGRLYFTDANGKKGKELSNLVSPAEPLVTPLVLYYEAGLLTDLSKGDRIEFAIRGQREGEDGAVIIRYTREGPLWLIGLSAAAGTVLFVIVPGVYFGTKAIARRRTMGATELGGEDDAKALKKLLREEEKKERQKAREREKMKKGGAGVELKRMKDGTFMSGDGQANARPRTGSRKASASGPTGVAARGRGGSPQRAPRGSTGRRQSGGRRQNAGQGAAAAYTQNDLQNQLVKPEFAGLIALLEVSPAKMEQIAAEGVVLTLGSNTHTLFVESVMRAEMKQVSMEGSAPMGQSTTVATTVIAAYLKVVAGRFMKDKFGGMVRTYAKAASFEGDHDAWVESGKAFFKEIVKELPNAPQPVRHPLSVMYKAVESLFPGEGHTVVAMTLLQRAMGALLKDPVGAGFMSKPPGDDGQRNLAAIGKFLAGIASSDNSMLPSGVLKAAAEAERPSLLPFVQKLTATGGDVGGKQEKPTSKEQAKALDTIHKALYAKWKEVDAAMRASGKVASMRELRDILVHCPEPAGAKRPLVLTTSKERRGSSPSKVAGGRRPSSGRPHRSNSRQGPKRA